MSASKQTCFNNPIYSKKYSYPDEVTAFTTCLYTLIVVVKKKFFETYTKDLAFVFLVFYTKDIKKEPYYIR